ncbi:MAG: hypothetical protein EBX52_11930 [Proteobacteria bacterium]|nr:hypothetical protein [Pseudomonadota bacterium]
MRETLILFLLIGSVPPAGAEPVPPEANSGKESSIEALLNEDLIRGLRDPFQPPVTTMAAKKEQLTELELFQLKDFKLNGIVTGPKKTRAMVSAPGNKTFFVKVGDRIGAREGKVTNILNDAIRVQEMVLNEKGKPVPDIYEIRINGDMVSLSKRDGE